MKVREFLQIELWSKRTSWKICIGIGVFWGVVLVAAAAHDAIEQYWLTSGERSEARAALSQIDELQNLVRSSDQDFRAKAKMVQKSIDLADKAAWTSRDRHIVFELRAYFFVPLIDRYTFRKQKPIKHELDEKLNSSGIKSSRMELLKELN
jgi:hypothetical protein